MAADNNKLPPLFLTFVLFFLLVPVPVCSSECVYGTYEHEKMRCCLCGAGEYLVKHCQEGSQNVTCKPCQTGWHSSSPNYQDSCERCTSCLHPNDNLEEDEPCFTTRDGTCRCKKDHFCVIQAESCKLCQPCTKCGEEGVKTACAGNTDTVCNEKTEGGNNHGRTVGIIVGVLLLTIILAGVVVFIWKKRTANADSTVNGIAMRTLLPNGTANADPNPNGTATMNVPPNDVDLQPHLLEIAEIIGWKDMRHVAMRSSMPTAAIEACQANHPNDVEEQTVQLLENWVERQGKAAPKILVQMLKDAQKNGKAQKVIDILSRDNQNPV